jgi:hypothetical protein
MIARFISIEESVNLEHLVSRHQSNLKSLYRNFYLNDRSPYPNYTFYSFNILNCLFSIKNNSICAYDNEYYTNYFLSLPFFVEIIGLSYKVHIIKKSYLDIPKQEKCIAAFINPKNKQFIIKYGNKVITKISNSITGKNNFI